MCGFGSSLLPAMPDRLRSPEGDPRRPRRYFLPLPFWASALAAAVFSALVERGLLRTLLAAVAALELVCLLFLATFVTPCLAI